MDIAQENNTAVEEILRPKDAALTSTPAPNGHDPVAVSATDPKAEASKPTMHKHGNNIATPNQSMF